MAAQRDYRTTRSRLKETTKRRVLPSWLLAEVAEDAKTEPARYLRESEVPHGGE